MTALLLAVCLLAVAGVLAFATSRHALASRGFGVGGVVAASVLGLASCFRVLLRGDTLGARHPWPMPMGSFHVSLDPLSAWFLVAVLILSPLAAVYGGEYLMGRSRDKAVGFSWLAFDFLVASMMLVLTARDGLLFLLAWEVMSLSSFFLVMFDHEKPAVRDAGWTYLVATHLGTMFLLVFFLYLGRKAGSLDFDDFQRLAPLPPAVAGVLFVMAIIGFGTKAGFVPFHVWLPEAHPAAPSHVSAVMSGVMIKTGIYGILRALTFLGVPSMWWGWLLVAVGISSGILGVLFALAQHDLKRLLAYHSVENIGIIALGLGLGVIGWAAHMPAMAVLGFGGGLLHVLNHAVFKGLLFLGAGSVLHAAHTADIEHLGGLIKRMPWTAGTFLVGAAAISGLPPLNGFVSEFLIFYGAFQCCTKGVASALVPAIGAIGGLALIGGLAAACFAKAFGIVFLGEPRSGHASGATDPGWCMRMPMIVLAWGCFAIAAAAPLAFHVLKPVVAQVTGGAIPAAGPEGFAAVRLLCHLAAAAAAILVLATLLAGLRRWLLAGRAVAESVTWDCGYAKPDARMQYTASSFAQPLVGLFHGVLRTRTHGVVPDSAGPAGAFPAHASFGTETPDGFRDLLFRPAFRGVRWVFARIRWIQHGRLQLYILYILLTLIALLVWYAWGSR